MTCTNDTNSKRQGSATLAAGLALSALLFCSAALPCRRRQTIDTMITVASRSITTIAATRAVAAITARHPSSMPHRHLRRHRWFTGPASASICPASTSIFAEPPRYRDKANGRQRCRPFPLVVPSIRDPLPTSG